MLMTSEVDNQPDLGSIDDDKLKTPEVVAEKDVRFRAQEIKRQETEFKIKEKSASQKRWEMLIHRL